jgi:hypothetical protein
MRKLRSSVRPADVTIRFDTVYTGAPAVPPDSQTVVIVLVLLSESFVSPVGTVHVDVEMVSPVANHEVQSFT